MNETENFIDTKRWLNSQRDRWLAFIERQFVETGNTKGIAFRKIDELCGMPIGLSGGIMKKATKKIRESHR